MVDRKFKARWMFMLLLVFGGLVFFGMNHHALAGKDDLPNVTWRLQCAYPPPEELFPGVPGAYGQVLKYARMVEKATGGKFKIQVFPSGQLFKTREMFNAVSSGAIQMGYGGSAYWGGKFPEAAVEIGLPGFIVSYESAKKMVWETDWLDILRSKYQKHGVYLLANTEMSHYNLVSKFPCRSVKDLKGKKIRATGNFSKALRLWGAVPVKTEPAEIYIALQRGTIDGTLYPAYSGITYKLFEVAKYCNWPGFAAPLLMSTIVNLKAYNKLPREYQDIMNKMAKEWSIWTFDKRGKAVDQYVRQKAGEIYNAEVIDLSPQALNEFVSLSRPIWDKYAAKTPECKKLIDHFNKALKY